jgi:hypothetical protein
MAIRRWETKRISHRRQSAPRGSLLQELPLLEAMLNRSRTIGAEYEMTVPLVGSGNGMDIQRALAQALTANGVRAIARPYSHDPLPNNMDIAVEFDNSVQGESRYSGIRWFPIEVKTRILTYDEWEALVPKTLDICRYLGARVNPSCGHHLHFGFPEIEQDPRHVRSIWNLFHRFNDVIFGIVAPSRRHSNFCRPMPPASKILHGANSIRTLKQRLGQYDRYYALNLSHIFDQPPRLELRHRDSTLDPNKARHWLRFCLQLVQHSVTRTCQAAPSSLPNDRKSLEKLLVTVGLKVNTRVYSSVSDELRETGRHLLQRWKGFHGEISLEKSKSNAAGINEEDVFAA